MTYFSVEQRVKIKNSYETEAELAGVSCVRHTAMGYPNIDTDFMKENV